MLAACAAPSPPAPPASGDEAAEAVAAARSWLAERLGVSIEAVAVVSSERREWSDGCLGLGGPAESCMAMMVPGWRVELEASGRRYEVRTDATGAVVRSPQLPPAPPGPPPG